MSSLAIRAAVAGAALLATPLGANAFTYHRAGPTRGYAPMHGYAGMHGYGHGRAYGFGYGHVAHVGGYGYRGGYRGRYGYGIGAAAAAVGYGAGYRGYGYGTSYGAGYPATYATGPYGSYGAGAPCGCTTPTYQTATTIAYVPVTTYKAVRVYYAPQQPPYYNVPPYAVK